MIELPSQLKIGPYDYEVMQMDEEHRKVMINEDLFGSHHTENSKIVVYLTGNSSIDVNTLWHEIKHALWFLFGLQDSDDEERIVNALSNGELMVLKDNPELLELITSVVTYEEEDA